MTCRTVHVHKYSIGRLLLKGELEATQLKKIDAEAEIRKELTALGISSYPNILTSSSGYVDTPYSPHPTSGHPGPSLHELSNLPSVIAYPSITVASVSRL
ncbi:hypothetical protein C8Q74DRAFT_9883 [Fomes fomentarius]|nr:hypothetical protein C8Q74DRAFT_9883 [Fomes fomentarius]